MKTVKVKILVAVDEDGRWAAVGLSGYTTIPRSWIDTDDLSDNVTYHWVEADIPIPVPQTFEGSVQEAGNE